MPNKPAVTKAVIPAAGLGTRFLPATKAIPKEMLPVVDKPAIQYVVEEAVAAGLRDILLVTGRAKGALEDHFDRAPELEQALKAKGDDERLVELFDPQIEYDGLPLSEVVDATRQGPCASGQEATLRAATTWPKAAEAVPLPW